MDDAPQDPFDNKRQQVLLTRALIAKKRAELLHYRLQGSFSKLYADYSEIYDRLENTQDELRTTQAKSDELRSASADEIRRLNASSDRYRRHLRRLTRWKDCSSPHWSSAWRPYWSTNGFRWRSQFETCYASLSKFRPGIGFRRSSCLQTCLNNRDVCRTARSGSREGPQARCPNPTDPSKKQCSLALQS